MDKRLAAVLLVLMIFVAVFGFSFQMLRYQLMEAGSGSGYEGPDIFRISMG